MSAKCDYWSKIVINCAFYEMGEILGNQYIKECDISMVSH